MTAPKPLPDILTTRDIAALFRVDPKTVSRWAASGKLPESFRTAGGQRRWYRHVVEPVLRGKPDGSAP